MAAPYLPPLPDASDKAVTPATGKSTLDQYLFLRRVEEILRRDPNVHAEYDHGALASGTLTPNPSHGFKQKATNSGAFTIAATAEIGNLELRVTNGAGAGAITFSGFDKQWTGDALTTTAGDQFVIFIHGYGGKQAYLVRALQ